MSREIKSIDITHTPELLHLAEEVAATMQPRSLQKAGHTLAVVLPVVSKTAPQRVPGSGEAAVARLRATHGTIPPRNTPEDFAALREEFERGVAEEVAEETP
jgi:hypothetical protein